MLFQRLIIITPPILKNIVAELGESSGRKKNQILALYQEHIFLVQTSLPCLLIQTKLRLLEKTANFLPGFSLILQGKFVGVLSVYEAFHSVMYIPVPKFAKLKSIFESIVGQILVFMLSMDKINTKKIMQHPFSQKTANAKC